jgi:mannosyltransferase
MNRAAPRTVALLLILLLATGLRFYRLDAQSFWNDEGNAARAAERTVGLILEAAEGDIHPPGYYLALHAWRAVAGESEFALRALSAFCSVLTVALTVALGRRTLGRGAGVGGALLAAVSPLAVYYAQEARMYALLGLLAAASTHLLLSLRAAPRPTSPRALAYVLTIAVGLYTHYAFALVLLVHNALFLAWLSVRGGRQGGGWRTLARWAVLQAGALLLFAPWLPTALRAVTGWPSAGREWTLGPALIDVYRVLAAGITLEASQARWGLIGAGAVLLAGAWPRQGKGRAVGALVAWLVLPVTLIFAFDLYKPAYLKFLLVVLPPVHLLLAHGAQNLAALTRRLLHARPALAGPVPRAVWAASCLLLIVSLCVPSLHNLYFSSSYARDDYRQIAADIAEAARPGDGVILDAPNQWEVFTYYHREGAPVYPIPRSRPPRADAVAAELEQVTAAHGRLFVLYWGDAEADPQRLVESWLAENAYKAGDRWYGRVRFSTYGLGPLPEEPSVEVDAHFGEVIRLLGYAASGDSFAPGDIVPATLFWEAETPVPDRYKVFLHLVDDHGQLVAQLDTEPRDGLAPTSIWQPGQVLRDRYGVLLPGDLPPGEYTLVAGLYHLLTAERLPVTLNGTPAGDHVVLGAVSVTP